MISAFLERDEPAAEFVGLYYLSRRRYPRRPAKSNNVGCSADPTVPTVVAGTAGLQENYLYLGFPSIAY